MKAFKIPPDVRGELSTLVASASRKPTATVALQRLVEMVSVLPPKAIIVVEDLVGHLPHALAVRRVPVWNARIEPHHAPVLMLNKSGYVRQAALRALTHLPDTPFFVAALVWRLNDWVQPVRRVAEDCAERLLPQMSVQAVVGAAPFLLERISTWGRWQAPPNILLRAIGRTDCTAELVVQFAKSAEISAGALRAAMRLGLLDDHFLALSRTAIRPEFRAVLLRALLDREVTWVTHYERQWVDKRYGITRRVPVLGRRRWSHSKLALNRLRWRTKRPRSLR